ncbi:MAG: methenyltetrahydromethanopterin cyclohydrolase [Thermofilum sp.]|jgi:methenyltetrahydromethanopterin cyclohydrolase|nr:methenyltetrahydromethanopterin cyclohydrolase [Thermofilum sp.]
MTLSMNKLAARLVAEMLAREEELKVTSTRIAGATVIDAGVKARSSFEAGIYVSKICLGGLASVSTTSYRIREYYVPAVEVSTDHPVEACMASQLAGWRISVKDFFANGSGPARALARKPKKLFEKIGYSEESDEAVLVLETEKYPDEDVIKYISSEARVKPESLYILLVSPASIAGSVQVSARIVETGMFKLHTLEFDLRTILYGHGVCPVAPLHSSPLKMAGRSNDMLLYGGVTFYTVDYPDDAKLSEYVSKAPSSASKDYGKSFTELVDQYGWDFLYKVDPSIFAPALLIVNNARSGSTLLSGRINYDVLERALTS